jgi:hypothetical protein
MNYTNFSSKTDFLNKANITILFCFALTIAVFVSFGLPVNAATIYESNYQSISYLGSTAADNVSGVEIQNDLTVVMGSTIQNNNFGVVPINHDGGGSGSVLRLSSDGKQIKTVARVGNHIDDIDVSPRDDTIVVNTDKGVYKLSSGSKFLLWKNSFGTGGSKSETNGRRVAAASNGNIVALVNKMVRVYDSNGNILSTFTVPGSRVNDIAIDSNSQTIFVVGDNQKDGSTCSELRVAYLYAYSYSGQLKWKAYDFTKEQAGATNSCADTALTRVYMGRDNRLYVAGWSAGGNSIFQKNPKDITKNTVLSASDQFNTPYNTASNNIGFYAKFDPVSGNSTKSQFILARLSTGKGNTINLRDIKIDNLGNIYIAGEAASKFVGRDNVKANNKNLGAYSGGDVFAIKVSPDMTQRQKVISFVKGGGAYKGGYVAAKNNFWVLAGRNDGAGGGEVYTTTDAIQSTKSNMSDVFYGITTTN